MRATLVAKDQDEDEPRQCYALSIAAALALYFKGDTPSYEEVLRYAKLLLDDMQDCAIDASLQLGEARQLMAQAEADVRFFIYDLVKFGHDKDFRTAAAFAPKLLSRFCLCFVRIDSRFQAHVVTVPGRKFKGEPKKCLWLVL